MADANAPQGEQAARAPGGGLGEMLRQAMQFVMLYWIVTGVFKSMPTAEPSPTNTATTANGAASAAPSAAPPAKGTFVGSSIAAITVELWDPSGVVEPLLLRPEGAMPMAKACVLNRRPVSAAVRLNNGFSSLSFSTAHPCLKSHRVRPLGDEWDWQPSMDLVGLGIDVSAACCPASSFVATDISAHALDSNSSSNTSEAVALLPDSAINVTECHPASCDARMQLRISVLLADDHILLVEAGWSNLTIELTKSIVRPIRRATKRLIGDDVPDAAGEAHLDALAAPVESPAASDDDTAAAANENTTVDSSSNTLANITQTNATLPPNVTLMERNVTLAVCTDEQKQAKSLRQLFRHKLSDGSPGLVVVHHDFWTLDRDRLQLNQTTAKNITLRVELKEVGILMAGMLAQMNAGMREHETSGLMRAGELDSFKMILLDNSPWYLGLCFTVSILRLIFEYLAFKNDVQFWRSKTGKDGSMQGLSLRSVAISCYFQLIIFLYLLDSEGTSTAVTLPSGIGVLIEFWKLFKCVRFQRDPVTGRPSIQWNRATQAEGEAEDATATHDRTAVRYMGYVGAPLLLAYTVYCALYEQQVGWYSFLIETQVRMIYYAGFAVMCPQIYINYKLKSVAAMPWRTLMYKFFNTIVDDLFAFVIAMPTLHRVACFRDDVIFVVLLYQRYKYPVDKNRVNEYGQGGEGGEEETAAAAPSVGATLKLKQS